MPETKATTVSEHLWYVSPNFKVYGEIPLPVFAKLRALCKDEKMYFITVKVVFREPQKTYLVRLSPENKLEYIKEEDAKFKMLEISPTNKYTSISYTYSSDIAKIISLLRDLRIYDDIKTIYDKFPNFKTLLKE